MDATAPGPSRDRLTAVTAGVAVFIALAGSAVATAVDRADSHDVASAVALPFFIGALAVVGAIVSLTVPANRVGRLLLVGAASLGAGLGLTEAGVHGVLTHGSVPGAGYMAAVGPALEAAGWLLTVIAVPVLFPDGDLPGPRWRWVGWTTTAAVSLLFLGNVLSPTAQQSRLAHWHSPLGLSARYANVADGLSLLAVLLSVVTAAAAVTGLIVRWRRGGPLVRQQLLLFAIAAGPPAVVLVAIIVTNGVSGWVFGVVGLPLPAAILLATVHHGLYDRRRAANRTLLGLTMSASVAAIYAVVVLTAAALVPDHSSWWPPAVAAVLAALVLLPLHHTLQGTVNRLVYGRWHQPYDVLAALGEQLEAAADVDRLLHAAVSELTSGLDLQDVGIRALDGTTIVGVTSTAATTLPLHAFGATVGWLTYRSTHRQLSTSEQRLLRDLSRHLGGAVHARRLRDDLQRARERLVLAREEERRRLRRDLHDGIGPALAGLTLKATTARTLLPPGSDAAAAQLHALGEEIRHTVTDVRRIVEGLRPPALDELGLIAACTQAIERLTADTGLIATLEVADEIPTLPAAVEVATYRIAIEAVTNIVRHARAQHCQIRLAVGGADLVLTVVDDGVGVTAARQPGSGLTIMRERAEELGGTFAVTDRAGTSGVTVRARLPLPAMPAAQRPAHAAHA
jgi:signal transduction histidine kinase